MTNPTPRPALRKAEDADVHPAAPAPARRPRTTSAAEAPPAAAPRSTSGGSTAAGAATPAKAAPRATSKAAPTSSRSASTAAAPTLGTAPRPAGPARAAAAEPAAVPDMAESEVAATRPSTPKRAKRYQTPPAVPVKNKRKRTGFGGTTSDHLRRSDAPAAAASLDAEKAEKKRRKADAALMSGPLEATKVKLPKKLRKAAEKEAAHRGLDLDAVLADLLHTWLTTNR